MRKSFIVTAIFTFLLTASAIFAAPTTLSHQGRLLDASGSSADGLFNITYRLYETSTGTTILWEETHGVQVSEGLYSVILGSITPLDMSNMTVHPDFLWLGIQVGSDSELLPRTKLNSVPSAAVASALQGEISTNKSVLIMTDSLGDTTIVWDANARKGNVKDLHPPGNGTGTAIAPGNIIMTDSLGDTTIVWDANLRRGIITEIHPPGNGTSRHMSMMANQLNIVDELGDTTFSIQSDIDSGTSITTDWWRGIDDDCSGVMTADESGARMLLGANSFDGGVLVSNSVNRLDHNGHVTVLKISNSGLDTTNVVGLFGDPDFAMVQVGDSSLIILDDTSGISLRMNKGELIDALAKLHMQLDDTSVIMYMNKAELIDAIASGIDMSILPSGVRKRAARTGRNPQTGATIQMSATTTLNDTTGVSFSLRRLDEDSDDDTWADLFVNADGNSGLTLIAAKKVAKFKAGAALAKAVNKAASNSAEGSSIEIVADLDKFIEITIDSVNSSFVFGDTLGDTTIIMNGIGGGGSGGSIQVISSNVGTGMAPSSVEIADLDSDGQMDIRVDGALQIGTITGTNIISVVQGSATDPIADAWTTYSSRRWKENIKTISGAMSKIEQLRGVEYDWKNDGKHDIGLIAEEVGAVIPEVVVFEENGIDAKSVDYPRLVALLIEASKEQQTNIKSMQAEIDELKALVTRLANQNSPNGNPTYGNK